MIPVVFHVQRSCKWYRSVTIKKNLSGRGTCIHLGTCGCLWDPRLAWNCCDIFSTVSWGGHDIAPLGMVTCRCLNLVSYHRDRDIVIVIIIIIITIITIIIFSIIITISRYRYRNRYRNRNRYRHRHRHRIRHRHHHHHYHYHYFNLQCDGMVHSISTHTSPL